MAALARLHVPGKLAAGNHSARHDSRVTYRHRFSNPWSGLLPAGFAACDSLWRCVPPHSQWSGQQHEVFARVFQHDCSDHHGDCRFATLGRIAIVVGHIRALFPGTRVCHLRESSGRANDHNHRGEQRRRRAWYRDECAHRGGDQVLRELPQPDDAPRQSQLARVCRRQRL